MKKVFFFAAAALAALTVNAEVATWHAVTVNGADTVVAEPNFADLEVAMVDGAGAWEVKGSITEETKVTVLGEAFDASYAQGSTNGMKGSLDKDGTTSAHIMLTPDYAGTIYVVAKYGKNKPVWAAKVPAADAEDLDLANMADYLIEGFSAVAPEENLLYVAQEANHTLVHYDDFTDFNDVYDYIALDVEPGYTYFFWVSGSKLMLGGLVYEYEATGINNTAAAVKATKTVVNGQLVIEKNGVRFNVLGAAL